MYVKVMGEYLDRQQGDLISLVSLLAYFPYFRKIEVGLCHHHVVCVSVYPPPPQSTFERQD
jgi:hypothetical protein